MTLFDLEDKDLFVYQGEMYQLLRFEDEDQRAIVIYWDEKKSQHEQNFNPYAGIEPASPKSF